MTLPTKLTLMRFVLTFVIMALLFTPGWIPKLVALVCFSLAVLTDWLDGYLARRWNQKTPLGALLDPIADKVLVLGLFLAFVQLALIPAWMVLVIALREFVITGVRMFAVSRHIVLSAATEGKHKTVSQMVSIAIILVALMVDELLGKGAVPSETAMFIDWVILASVWVAMVLTVISGASFFWRHRTVLMDAAKKAQ